MYSKPILAALASLLVLCLLSLAAFGAPNLTTMTISNVSNGNGSIGNGSTQVPSSVIGQAIQGASSNGGTTLVSGFAASSNGTALAVTLGYFHADRQGETVIVNWETATENGTAGFHLFGALGGERVQLTDQLVPSTVIDAATPTDYVLDVDTSATTFWLEEIGVNGESTLHGPFAEGDAYGNATQPANLEMQPAGYLPMVMNE